MIINPFFNAAPGTVNLTDHIVNGFGQDAVNGASASFSLLSSGVADKDTSIYGGGSTNTPFAGEWLVTGSNSEFESRMTTVSGTCTGSATGSWLANSSSLTWTRTRTLPTGIGTTTYQGTLEIRRASDLTVLETQTITLNAEIQA